MKKLVAVVLTGVLVAGTLSTGVYAKDDDKTITVAASATPHAEILEEAKPILEKEGYDLITPVVVTNISDYIKAVCMEKEDAAVNAGDKFLTIV